jgi:hypothetical protein
MIAGAKSLRRRCGKTFGMASQRKRSTRRWCGGEWQGLLCCALLAGSTQHVVENIDKSVFARPDPTRDAISDFVLRVLGV